MRGIQMFTILYNEMVPGIVGKYDFPKVDADSALILIQTGHPLLNTVFDHKVAKRAECVTLHESFPMVDKLGTEVGEHCLLSVKNGGFVVSSFADGTTRTHTFTDGELTETVDVTTEMALKALAAQIAAERESARVKRQPVKPEDGKKQAPKKKAPAKAESKAPPAEAAIALLKGPCGTGETMTVPIPSLQEFTFKEVPEAELVGKEIIVISDAVTSALSGNASAVNAVLLLEESDFLPPALTEQLAEAEATNVVSITSGPPKPPKPPKSHGPLSKEAHQGFEALASLLSKKA